MNLQQNSITLLALIPLWIAAGIFSRILLLEILSEHGDVIESPAFRRTLFILAAIAGPMAFVAVIVVKLIHWKKKNAKPR
jgi:hypothetical protein